MLVTGIILFSVVFLVAKNHGDSSKRALAAAEARLDADTRSGTVAPSVLEDETSQVNAERLKLNTANLPEYLMWLVYAATILTVAGIYVMRFRHETKKSSDIINE